MEQVSLRELSPEVRLAILRELGVDTDGEFVVRDGAAVLDPFTHEPVRLDNMLIFPGSTIILNNTPLSIASYLEQYGDHF